MYLCDSVRVMVSEGRYKVIDDSRYYALCRYEHKCLQNCAVFIKIF